MPNPKPTTINPKDSRYERGTTGGQVSSNEGRDYLGLKLDDPSFNAPIYANLFDDEEGDTFSLIWSRPNGRRGD